MYFFIKKRLTNSRESGIIENSARFVPKRAAEMSSKKRLNQGVLKYLQQ